MKKSNESLLDKKISLPLQRLFRDYFSLKRNIEKCPDGGIGRRAGLKHQWIHFHAGSIPALGTQKMKA